MKSKFYVVLIFILSLYDIQAKANENNYLKGFYITAGVGKSLSNTKFEEKSALKEENKYDLANFSPNMIQSAKHLLNLGVGYEVNKFFAVELNYKHGLLMDYSAELIKYEDYFISKNNENYSNKSDNYIMYLVGKLPLPTEYITPFVKVGLGYSQHKSRQSLTSVKLYDEDEDQVEELRRAAFDYDYGVQTMKNKIDGISYHMQVGTDINLNQHNVFSIFWGADYMSSKIKTNAVGKWLVEDAVISKDEVVSYSGKGKKQNVFDNFIGVNYIYKF